MPRHIRCNYSHHHSEATITPGLEPRGPDAQPGAEAFLLPDSFDPLPERNSPFNPLPGFYQSKSLVDDENASKEPVFNPEAVIAHCFKQFKQEDFHLPQSPRRIIILPRKEALMPVNPTPQPQAPPEPTLSSKALEVGDIQEQPKDPRAWLTQRLKVRQDLESFGNVERWLQNKSRLTPSEAKVLHKSHKEHEARLMGQLATTRDTKVSSPICQMQTLRVLGACCHFTPLN